MTIWSAAGFRGATRGSRMDADRPHEAPAARVTGQVSRSPRRIGDPLTKMKRTEIMTAIDASMTVVIVLDHAKITGGQAKVAFDSAHRPEAARSSADRLRGRRARSTRCWPRPAIRTICLGQTDLSAIPRKLAAAVPGHLEPRCGRKRSARFWRACRADRTIVHVHGWAKALSPSIAVPIASIRPAGRPRRCTNISCSARTAASTIIRSIMPAGSTRCPPPCWATNCDSRSYTRKLWRGARQVVAKHVADLPGVFSDIICISEIPVGEGGPPPAEARADAPGLQPDRGRRPRPQARCGRRADHVHRPDLAREGAVPVCRSGAPGGHHGDVRRRGTRRRRAQAQRYPEARMLGWQGPEAVREHHARARARSCSRRSGTRASLWPCSRPRRMGTPVIVSDGCAGREEIGDGVDRACGSARGDAERSGPRPAPVPGEETSARHVAGGLRRHSGPTRRRSTGTSRAITAIYAEPARPGRRPRR